MHTVSAESNVNLTAEQCWQFLSDISLPHHYVPGVIKTEIVTDQTTGVGASRLVYQKPNKPMGETVTEWREGEGFTISIHKPDGGPQPPFKEATFTYAIERRGTDTVLVNSMSYDLGEGLMSKVLDALVLRWVTRNMLGKITRAQAAFYEKSAAEI